MLASASHAFATESSHCQRSPQLLYLKRPKLSFICNHTHPTSLEKGASLPRDEDATFPPNNNFLLCTPCLKFVNTCVLSTVCTPPHATPHPLLLCSSQHALALTGPGNPLPTRATTCNQLRHPIPCSSPASTPSPAPLPSIPVLCYGSGCSTVTVPTKVKYEKFLRLPPK